MGFRRIPRGIVLGGGAAVIAAAMLATTGIGQAAVANGPTVYLNHHGSPRSCSFLVDGTLDNGRPYKDSRYRASCDGTFELPVMKKDTPVSLTLWSGNSDDDGRNDKEFTVTDNLDYQGNIDNNTAICFLAKAGGKVIYTNMSPKGGDCNGD